MIVGLVLITVGLFQNSFIFQKRKYSGKIVLSVFVSQLQFQQMSIFSTVQQMGVDAHKLHLVFGQLSNIVGIRIFWKQLLIKELVQPIILGCFLINKTTGQQKHCFILDLVGIGYFLVEKRVSLL